MGTSLQVRSILTLYLFFTREVQFDLILEGEAVIVGLNTLEDVILAFLYLCFCVNLKYPLVRLNFPIGLFHETLKIIFQYFREPGLDNCMCI